MKIGDKVFLKKFSSNDSLAYVSRFDKIIGEKVTVAEIDEDDGTFYVSEFDCWWLISACGNYSEPVKNERYFLFTYVSGNNTGNIWLKNEIGKVPSNKFLKEHSRKTHGLDNLVITNVFEFKSEQDFLDFTSNE